MNALQEKIFRLIRAQGPISVAQYMQMALTDPEHGYYMSRDPLGAAGDFITAPEVSQMFGELIGLWFAQAWEDRGRPNPFHLVELGPGRGTLMADMLRAAKLRPDFLTAAKLTLVEASPALRDVQARTLQAASARPSWTASFNDVPDDAPLFLVANEFLDALPVHQFVKSERGWHERMITGEGERLSFALAPEPVPADFIPARLRDAAAGTIFEYSPAAQALIGDVAGRVARSDGAALFIDYGHEQSGLGDSFQAVKAHTHADPLAEPGQADLTAHVDFEALSAVAREADTCVFGPKPQGAFLHALGIEVRAERLKRGASAAAKRAIDSAVDRLMNPAQMGTLFKVMAISDGHFRGLPGFPC